MINQNKKITEIRRAEENISRHLFFICVVVTIATMFLMVTDFFTKGKFLPARIGFFYLTVVLIYSIHKEIVRWIGEKKDKRQGEYFVYAWIILTTVLYTVNFFYRNYYSYSTEGYPVGTLRDITYLTVEVLGVFIFTRILKLIFLLRK